MNAQRDDQPLFSINNESLISVGGASSSNLVPFGVGILAGLGFGQRSRLMTR